MIKMFITVLFTTIILLKPIFAVNFSEDFKCVDLNRDYKTDILDVIQLVNIILEM